jgi:hypothetical protein
MTNAERVSMAVLYSVQFNRYLDDEEVTRIAQAMLKRPLIQDLTPQEEYAALVEALGLSVKLTELIPQQTHGEQEFRDFLRRLLDRLDAMRPWPELP